MCLGPSALDEFQHSMLKHGALAQQSRLRMLLPALMPPADAPDAAFPSLLQWAFACVRSRAFVVTDKAAGGKVDMLASANMSAAGKAGEAAGAEQGGEQGVVQDAEDGGSEATRQAFKPSEAAVAEAKAAARKSGGGFAMLIPENARDSLSAATSLTSVPSDSEEVKVCLTTRLTTRMPYMPYNARAHVHTHTRTHATYACMHARTRARVHACVCEHAHANADAHMHSTRTQTRADSDH